MGWECGTCGEKRDGQRFLMGKPERKSPLEKPRQRQEGNIKTEVKQIRRGRRLD
jgi:hypothetical protein